MNTSLRKTSSNLRQPTRLACGLIPLLNMMQARGVDTRELLNPVGIGRFEFLDPAFTITLDQELAIISRAIKYLPEPDAGLQLAHFYHLHNFSVLGLALRSCSTLGECFELIREFPRLQWGICKTTGHLTNNTIVFELQASETREERLLLERDMACIKTLFSEVLDNELRLEKVTFAYPAPADTTPYKNLFNCPVLFNQPATTLLIPLERKLPAADPLSRDFYVAQCVRLSAQMDEPFRYSWLIRDQLLHLTPMPGLESLSEHLHIEPRTLQRRLKKEGTRFSTLLQDVRLKRAFDRLLYTNMTVEQIATELGFNEAVAFSHAFKQWTGQSPRQWRNDQLQREEES